MRPWHISTMQNWRGHRSQVPHAAMLIRVMEELSHTHTYTHSHTHRETKTHRDRQTDTHRVTETDIPLWHVSMQERPADGVHVAVMIKCTCWKPGVPSAGASTPSPPLRHMLFRKLRQTPWPDLAPCLLGSPRLPPTAALRTSSCKPHWYMQRGKTDTSHTSAQAGSNICEWLQTKLYTHLFGSRFQHTLSDQTNCTWGVEVQESPERMHVWSPAAQRLSL